MTSPDDMIKVPRRDLEEALHVDDLSDFARRARARLRRLLEPPKCGAVMFLDVPEHPHHPGVPSHPHFLAKAPCVLPAGHHAPRRSSMSFDCIRCTASADDPIHEGPRHQVDPALWIVP